MRIFKRLALLCAVATLTGCASFFWEERDDLRFQKYATREILEHEGTGVSLPPHYSESTDKGRLTMTVTPGSLVAQAFFSNDSEKARENKAYFTLRMQSELTKQGRFDVVALEGNDDDYLRELADVGDIRLPKKVEQKEIDYDLGWNVTVEEDTNAVIPPRQEGRATITCLPFVANVVISGKDKRTTTGAGNFTKTYDRVPLRCYQRRNRYGHRTGFRVENEFAVKKLMQTLALNIAKRAINEIYWSNPVTGEVTGTFGENMQLNRGSLDGIMPGHVMTIYVRRSGVVIPVAFATATPAEKTSVLEVWKWAKPRDRRMREVVEAIREKGLDEGPIYAVTYGVPTPPDYELKEIVIE